MDVHVRRSAALHPERESLSVLSEIRSTAGEYNFASQYLQSPAPLEGGMVRAAWFKSYAEKDLPERFDQVIQSWDTANKPTELADYSVCTTMGIKDKRIYILNVYRKKVNYPDLKRAVREQAAMYNARIVLIENKASGTQLIQELVREGLLTVKEVNPSGNKTMRFNAQTATIENGFVYLPAVAHWLEDFLYEITTFPSAKYDDQADSISQALEWINSQPSESGLMLYYDREAAMDLHNQGFVPEAIAKKVGRPLDTVKKWIVNPRSQNQNALGRVNTTDCTQCGDPIYNGAPYQAYRGRNIHASCYKRIHNIP